MIYKFKSKATADLLMLGPQGDELMRLLGREAPSPRGIVEPGQMAQALARLHAAIADQEALLHERGAKRVEADAEAAGDEEQRPASSRALPLRTRLWPMIQMLERCQVAGEPVVWGV